MFKNLRAQHARTKHGLDKLDEERINLKTFHVDICTCEWCIEVRAWNSLFFVKRCFAEMLWGKP